MAQVDMAGQVETLLGRALTRPSLPAGPGLSLSSSLGWPPKDVAPWVRGRWRGFPFLVPPPPRHLCSGEIGLEVFTRNLGDSLRREQGG